MKANGFITMVALRPLELRTNLENRRSARRPMERLHEASASSSDSRVASEPALCRFSLDAFAPSKLKIDFDWRNIFFSKPL